MTVNKVRNIENICYCYAPGKVKMGAKNNTFSIVIKYNL